MSDFLRQQAISINHLQKPIQASIPLPSSKSESNRALIIQAIGGDSIQLENLSSARDTQTMIRLLKSDEPTLDVLDAGTTMRFLTAFCTAINRTTLMTGTERMQNRPIGILVDALRSIGGEIEYKGKEGYPPHQIKGFQQSSDWVKIRGDVSSQYISALLMIAPQLPEGLNIELEGEIGSKPYIQMTLSLMERFGVKHSWKENVIAVKPQTYQSGKYAIESDWSGASYWFSVVALAQEGTEVFLKGLREDSLQGDRAIVEIMTHLGVKSKFEENGIKLTKGATDSTFDFDFTDCPDLAQTVSVVCAALNLPSRLSGLASLRIKETDRIEAIKTELQKFGAKVEVKGDEEIIISPAEFEVSGQTIHTYEDHRMAMAFAPLALLGNIKIEEPSVVAKSYPSFWVDFQNAGFGIR